MLPSIIAERAYRVVDLLDDARIASAALHDPHRAIEQSNPVDGTKDAPGSSPLGSQIQPWTGNGLAGQRVHDHGVHGCVINLHHSQRLAHVIRAARGAGYSNIGVIPGSPFFMARW